ncbi:MAG: hypothetical protein H0U70_09995 [Tatlockia sp.]|nr:hypothetical protein [Tatlockia sp.]
MWYLIEGSFKQVCISLGAERTLALKYTNSGAVANDVGRTYFLGTPREADLFKTAFLKVADEHYTQGNFTAESIILAFGRPLPDELLLPEEKVYSLDDKTLIKQLDVGQVAFAYRDDSNKLCALSIYYRKSHPDMWIIAHAKDTNLNSDQHQLKILASFNPETHFKKNNAATLSSRSTVKKDFIQAIDSKKVNSFINLVINSKGEIDPKIEQMNLFVECLGPNFSDKTQLFELFPEHLSEILANDALKIINQNKIRPTAAQIMGCLSKNNPIYQLIIENQDNKQLLDFLLFLDSMELNIAEFAEFKDPQFIENLIKVRYFDQNKLIQLLKAKKINGLSFILKTDFSQQLFNKFLTVETSDWFWLNLNHLAQENWEFPADNFRHALACQMLFNLPQRSSASLLAVLAKLPRNSVLEEIFSPIDLANFLSQKFGLAESHIDWALQYFAEVLPAFKQNIKLNSNLRESLAEHYLQNPGDKFLKQLYFCTEKKEIQACYILDKLNFEIEQIKELMQNPRMPEVIIALDRLDLNSSISSLLSVDNLEVLEQIFTQKNFYQREAFLIIAARFETCLNFNKFAADVKTFPYLAKLVIELNNKKFNIEETVEILTDPLKHHAAYFLNEHKLNFDSKDLTPFVCQTLRFLNSFLKVENDVDEQLIRGYLNRALPLLLLNIHSNSQLLLNEEETQSSNLLEIDGFLRGQQRIFAAIVEFYKQLNPHELKLNSKIIADELAWALTMLENSTVDNEVYLPVLEGFISLAADLKINHEITENAVNAYCNLSRSWERKDIDLTFAQLLQNPKLAKAMLCVENHRGLYSRLFTNDLPDEDLINRLAKLYDYAPKNKDAFNLAYLEPFDENEKKKTHDFRLLLDQLPKNSGSGLIPHLLKNLQHTSSEKDLTNYSAIEYKPIQNGILINRLRALNLDDDLIDFMFAKGKKNESFYQAILKIELKSDQIKQRLKTENPKKYQALLNGEKEYRATLYQAMYNSLTLIKVEGQQEEKIETFIKAVKEAEKKMATALKMDSAPILRGLAVIIVNMLTIALSLMTLGAASYLHYNYYQKTGDLFFYTSTRSEIDYKSLDQEIVEEVASQLSKPN